MALWKHVIEQGLPLFNTIAPSQRSQASVKLARNASELDTRMRTKCFNSTHECARNTSELDTRINPSM